MKTSTHDPYEIELTEDTLGMQLLREAEDQPVENMDWLLEMARAALVLLHSVNQKEFGVVFDQKDENGYQRALWSAIGAFEDLAYSDEEKEGIDERRNKDRS